ncbi:MAG TPA: type II toxin-antitoxin system VapC family toxin [Leptospiraceae bacterium]|nr:type II toxin-antitoxin system VapC family toxin [Leptospiraceae bacterium]HMW08096.1 type II toxin-antitoxin system VapC family toxin [Leptospiraceae bacterium]HMY33807.1 type II toxin-antitoxin system VapC family toxin [Leptospiraceae bacterium]HMZ65918.1 type II toxin-antitoxin system VapC family toxin [Leptospiraceae bacterium]HNA08860.1 type II toxin-antitoxin system VapC family toxin [Leptospiraceae bacterium]
MKSFFDTSALVKKYIEEDGSDAVSELFQNSDEIALSPITRIEFQSALQRLVNTNVLTQESYEIALAEFTEDSVDYEFISFNSTLEELVIEVIKKYGLRSLDGIQLAAAKISKSDQFITSDTKLFEAAKKELPQKNIFI